MLVIRDAQMAALQRARDLAFARWALGYLRDAVPAAVPDDDAVCLERIVAGLRQSRHYRFGTRSAVVRYVELMFELAPRFDELPGIRRALAGGERSPDLAIHSAKRLLGVEDWALIHATDREEAWRGLVEDTPALER